MCKGAIWVNFNILWKSIRALSIYPGFIDNLPVHPGFNLTNYKKRVHWCYRWLCVPFLSLQCHNSFSLQLPGEFVTSCSFGVRYVENGKLLHLSSCNCGGETGAPIHHNIWQVARMDRYNPWGQFLTLLLSQILTTSLSISAHLFGCKKCLPNKTCGVQCCGPTEHQLLD